MYEEGESVVIVRSFWKEDCYFSDPGVGEECVIQVCEQLSLCVSPWGT